MYRALTQAVILVPEDTAIAGKAKVNEGEVSTMLGMKGIPIAGRRTDDSPRPLPGRIHRFKNPFHTISTARSVELIREASAKG
jgi:dihydroorotase